MWKKFAYKLSRDLLISLIITYFLLLIPELILPGLISAHFDPKYLLVSIVVLGLANAWFGKGQSKRESPKFLAISRNLLNIILFVIAIMLFLTLYKMKIWEILVVIILAIPILISAENILIKEK